jgi:hypothetical protein
MRGLFGDVIDEIDWSVPQRQTRAVAEFLTALMTNTVTPSASRQR